MKKLIKTLTLTTLTLGAIHTGTSPVHASPTLTWDTFDCTHYSSSGFQKAGYHKGMHLVGNNDEPPFCAYGYSSNDVKLTIMRDPESDPRTIKDDMQLWRNFINEDAKKRSNLFEITGAITHNTTIHNHPTTVTSFYASDPSVIVSKVLCSSVKTSDRGNICLLTMFGTPLSDTQMINLARAMIA